MSSISNLEREADFNNLCSRVYGCRTCQRMCDSTRILSQSSGFLKSELMFIGEAPGRLGADGSGIPFHGDKAGHNFEELIQFVGLERNQIFVTNAVLCNPRDENGNNATPSQSEIKNCSTFLKEQIEIVNPKIIVTLGANSLAALKFISTHDLSLKDHVRTSNTWLNRKLIPLYHPGQRAMIHRSFANQRSDYQFVADQYKLINKKKVLKSITRPQITVELIVDYLFHKKNSFTYFALHKLFYLIEYKSVQKFGHRLTNSYIVRQKDGPYCTELHIFKLQKALPYIKSKLLSKTNIMLYKSSSELFDCRLVDQFEIDDSIKELIEEVLLDHGNKSNAHLKRTVYFTRPMRNILSMETNRNMNLYSKPIEFSLEKI